MKDWLGQEVSVGDTVIYAAGSGRSITMVVGEILEFKDNGNVKVRPIQSSRWKQHYGRTRWIDNRTGKGIDPFRGDKHVKTPAYVQHQITGETMTTEEYDSRRSVIYRDGTEWRNWKYIPDEFKDYVEMVVEPTKVVTLQVTENITKIEGIENAVVSARG